MCNSEQVYQLEILGHEDINTCGKCGRKLKNGVIVLQINNAILRLGKDCAKTEYKKAYKSMYGSLKGVKAKSSKIEIIKKEKQSMIESNHPKTCFSKIFDHDKGVYVYKNKANAIWSSFTELQQNELTNISKNLTQLAYYSGLEKDVKHNMQLKLNQFLSCLRLNISSDAYNNYIRFFKKYA